jgi:hypothetical protein
MCTRVEQTLSATSFSIAAFFAFVTIMHFSSGVLLVSSILFSHQTAATVSPLVINTMAEYSNAACPSWITILYTVISRSKTACIAVGLQNIFCQTVQYNTQNSECVLIADRISTNMMFVSYPYLFTINLNRGEFFSK